MLCQIEKCPRLNQTIYNSNGILNPLLFFLFNVQDEGIVRIVAEDHIAEELFNCK